MKNQNKRVLALVSACFFIYLLVSIIFKVFSLSWEPFDRINLIADVFPNKEKQKADSLASQPKINVKETTEQDFDLYKKPEFITNFNKGEHSSLPKFMEKLNRLKKGENVKIRIAYFGDSMIEGDLLTQTLRKLLQQEYGGYGVGYLPISSNVAGFRQTATTSASGWNDTSFKTKGATNMYLSGHYFTGDGSGSYTDNTIKNDSLATPITKSVIYGRGGGSVSVNGTELSLGGNASVNKESITDSSHQIKLKGNAGSTPIYGVSFESQKGIFVDNFSFRGITGVELNKLDEDFIKAIQENNHYDLIVLQYGVNLLFRPNDTDYSYYAKLMKPVLAKLKNSFSDADFLVVSSADRAFRYDGTYKTAKGLPNLLETQAQLAIENGFAFYNQFESMGGTNSIVKWANETPPLANKDYVHPNGKGADILAEKIYHAIQNDYKKYLKKK
ncbi:hypothetical protein HZP23_10060 [Elizabethkingia anophelis]|nr:hypothetical protein [Elizabethkingia anophelis]MCT4301184.1 hypothetical protein [Elizabethkingia anophelis]